MYLIQWGKYILSLMYCLLQLWGINKCKKCIIIDNFYFFKRNEKKLHIKKITYRNRGNKNKNKNKQEGVDTILA